MAVCHAPECKTKPSIGFELDLKPISCAKHRTADMINVTRRKCIISKCSEQGTFGYPGLPRGSRCEEHMIEGMILCAPAASRKSIKTKMLQMIPRAEEIRYTCRVEGCEKIAPYWDPYIDYVHLCDDHALMKGEDSPILQILTPCVLFTATISYKTTFRGDYRLVAEIPLSDKILAIKSVATPLEKCMENPYMGADRIIKKQNLRNEAVMAGDKSRKQKKTPGNGLYFQASDEFVIRRDEGGATKPYKIRVFPSTGTAQITGVQMPLVTGDKELRFVLDTISSYLGTDPIEVVDRSVNMLNFKLIVRSPSEGSDNWFISLFKVVTLFRRYLTGDTMQISPPYTVGYVTPASEICSYIYIDFLTPTIKKPTRRTRVKVYTKRKISIFAAPTFEIARDLTIYLDRMFVAYPEILVDISYRVNITEPLSERDAELVKIF